MSKYRVVHRCTDYCTPSCIQRAITTLKTFFLQQQPLRKQIVWGSQPIVSCLEKLFQDFRQCSSALYLQERFCSFVCCFRSLSPPLPGSGGGAAALCAARRIRQRGAFACKSLSSFFFSPPNSYLSSGGRREIEVFFLLLLLFNL